MKVRIVIAVLLTGAMATIGVGCTGQPPSDDFQAQNQAQWVGNFFFFLIYQQLCANNGGVCPFPLGPSDPPSTG